MNRPRSAFSSGHKLIRLTTNLRAQLVDVDVAKHTELDPARVDSLGCATGRNMCVVAQLTTDAQMADSLRAGKRRPRNGPRVALRLEHRCHRRSAR
jgi:hypothetical protein